MIFSELPGGFWSATPTPLTADDKIDKESIQRMVDHHVGMGARGLLLGGTCGEGPWLSDAQREDLVRSAAEASAGRLVISMQVTDNSALRTLDNIALAGEWGADLAIVSSPYFFFNATASRLAEYYQEVAERTTLPLAYYDRGKAAPYQLDSLALEELLAQPSILLVKDSSCDENVRATLLKAREKRPQLLLMLGDEFNCDTYLKAGYDGLMLGGGIFNGEFAMKILQASFAEDWATVEQLQQQMNELMFAVYGGPKITCWMSGLKYLLVQMGIFSSTKNYLGYPLTDECKRAIDRIVADKLYALNNHALGRR